MRILADHGDDAKVLAGGQSLVPALNMRLARPRVIVDINDVRELASIREDGDGVAIGALVRQTEAEHSAMVAARVPLLKEALRHVAHPQIRNRGTVVGSLVHADPAAELPAVALVLGARFKLVHAAGTRIVAAEDFYVTYFTTAAQPGEVVTEVWFPGRKPRTVSAFVEISRRHGDFAIVGVAAEIERNPDGTCRSARLALTGVADRPVRATSAERILVGGSLSETEISRAAETVACDLDPPDDVHASADYRREIAAVLVRRAVGQALARAL